MATDMSLLTIQLCGHDPRTWAVREKSWTSWHNSDQ